MKLLNILKDIKYTLIKGDIDCEVYNLKQNSGEVEENDCYIAIKGYNLDGHDYIPEAIEKGAKVIVLEKMVKIYGDVCVILVDNTRIALAKMAKNFFDNPQDKLYLIGVSGTSGKTTTTYIIKKLIEANNYPCGLIGSNGIKYLDREEKTNNTTPDAYTIYKTLREMADKGIKYVVIEASSQAFKLHRLVGLTFDIGLITNLTIDHIGKCEHASLEEYIACKRELLVNSKEIVINNDSLYLEELLKGIDKKITRYALKKDADLKVTDYQFVNDKERLTSNFKVEGLINDSFTLCLPGLFNIYNTLGALSVIKQMNLEIKKEVLENIVVEGRMQLVGANNKFKVIIDYAHSEEALEQLVSTMQSYHPKRLISIFGAGGNRSIRRRYALGKIVGSSSSLVILTMDNPRFEELSKINEEVKKGLNEVNAKYVEINDRKEAIIYALNQAEEGDIILLIGKGCEKYQDIKGVKYYFNEEEIIKEYLLI